MVSVDVKHHVYLIYGQLKQGLEAEDRRVAAHGRSIVLHVPTLHTTVAARTLYLSHLCLPGSFSVTVPFRYSLI